MLFISLVKNSHNYKNHKQLKKISDLIFVHFYSVALVDSIFAIIGSLQMSPHYVSHKQKSFMIYLIWFLLTFVLSLQYFLPPMVWNWAEESFLDK